MAFEAVEAREARADLLRLVGTILFGLAGVVLVVMLVSLFRRASVKTTADSWQVSPRTVVAAVQTELADVAPAEPRRMGRVDSSGARWPPPALAAAMASGRQASQSRATAASTPLEGQLLVRGLLGRGGALVSGSMTAQSVSDANVASSLLAFSAARYGRSDALDSSTLDDALDTAMATARRAASEHSWMAELLKRKARG